MSTRAAIRPRQVDNNKPLLIVTELSELDSADGQQQAGENGNFAADGHGHGAQQHKKPKPIPIPDIREVETHYRDYLPLFSHPLTYLHGKGCGGNKELEPVEYDLDNEDEDWLEQYNIGRSRLSDTLFERMLWKLELECAAATDNALTAAGAGPSERNAASAVAAIDHLPRQDAIRMLMLECGGREKLCIDVYNYWASKRKKWGKPILRRLQAPTLASDTDPFHTFRTREKTNRPQTRRRRDNSDELMDKLRQLRDNLAGAKQILEEVVRRERRKRDLACTEVELLRIQYRSRHEVGMTHDQVSTEGLAALRDRMRVNGNNDQIRAGARILPNKTTLPPGVQLSKKRRTEIVLKCLPQFLVSIQNHQPPPPVEPEALWAMPANLLQIPLESKEKQRDRVDDIRRGRPPGLVKPGVAAAAANPGGTTATATAAANPAAVAAGAAAGATAAAAAGADAATGAAAGAAAAATAAAAQQQQQGAPGLPPPGPSAPAVGGRMSAVLNSLNERSHLFKLPDGLSNNLGSWRCFIGRGGRARLERIDHVTHESLNNVKMEQHAIQQHYVTEPWPPMPTAPLLRELVEKSRPMPPRSAMHRAGSMGLASQGSAGSMGAAAARRTSSANVGAAAVAAQPAAALPQQQPVTAGAAAATPAAAAVGNGAVAGAAAAQQQQPPQALSQQPQQPQQAHTLQPHQQPMQQHTQMQQMPQQQQQGMPDQQQQSGMGAAAGMQQGTAPMVQQPQQQQMQDPAAMAAAQQQNQQTAYMAAMQQQQPMGAMQQQQQGMAYPGAAGGGLLMQQQAPGAATAAATGMAAGAGVSSMMMGQYGAAAGAAPGQQQQGDMQAAMAQQQQQAGVQDPAAAAAMGMHYGGGGGGDMGMAGYAAAGPAAAAMPASARKGPGRPPKGKGQLNGMDA